MPIHFDIVRDGSSFSATADGGAPFYIGRKTGFEGMEGLFNVPRRELPKLVYDAANFRTLGFWAEFVAPTAKCEGGNFLTLNTYDRARFTWGFGQFAAHVPDGDFIRFFRAMLGRPERDDYFPDLEVVNGRICKMRLSGAAPLESATSTALLMDMLNPSAFHVEDTEVIAAAKFIHWTTVHAGAQALQADHMAATFRRLMSESDRRLGLDGRTADLCAIVCDIRHQGRGKFAAMLAALRANDPFDALLEIGQPKFASRCTTLEKALTAARARFQSKTWSRGQQDFV